jgi:hypothetical protein
LKICQKVKLKLDDLNKFVNINYGGKLLSTEYIKNKEKLQWECLEKHNFWMAAHSVKNGKQWCPKCKEGKTENMCREIFEEIFKYSFNKIRPKWLIGNKGMPLELDGYCKELNLAFEYNGIQHYRFTEKFHNNYQKFIDQQLRDKLKNTLCENLGIILITVPYIKKYDRESLFKIINEIIKNKQICMKIS